MPSHRPDRAPSPDGFAEMLAPVLGDELDAFLRAVDQPPGRAGRGVRANPARITVGELTALLGRSATPLPWCPEGLVLAGDPGEGVALGRHPAHLAGLCYLQEPSSMAAVTALDPRPGWRVADLAAAPGGKTTQLASLVGPEGLVVANEVVAGRLGALHDNLDRWGATTVVTVSDRLDRLPVPPGGYDAVLLDAPCTGEGLWRRDPAARLHWSPAAVAGAAHRQAELLVRAAALVAEGGVLVYSTCTFNRAENEDRVVELLSSAPGWELEDLRHLGASPGCASPGPAGPGFDTSRTARFWPHRDQGEGQFVARLRRGGAAPRAGQGSTVDPAEGDRDRAGRGSRGGPGGRTGPGDRGARGDRRGRGRAGGPDAELGRAWERFRVAAVPGFEVDDHLLRERAGWLFALPPAAADLVGPAAVGPPGRPGRSAAPVGTDLRRPGLPLGRLRPGRFEPHPALATALAAGQAADTVSWTDDDPELAAYLRGETVAHPGADGWVLVCYHRWALGWARRSRGVLKNAFPPHLRRQAAGLPLGR